MFIADEWHTWWLLFWQFNTTSFVSWARWGQRREKVGQLFFTRRSKPAFETFRRLFFSEDSSIWIPDSGKVNGNSDLIPATFLPRRGTIQSPTSGPWTRARTRGGGGNEVVDSSKALLSSNLLHLITVLQQRILSLSPPLPLSLMTSSFLMSSFTSLSISLPPFKVTAFEGASNKRITFKSANVGKRQHTMTLNQGFLTKNVIRHRRCNVHHRHRATIVDFIATAAKKLHLQLP